MCQFMIVPNELSDEIYRCIDKELERCPEAAPERERFYRELLQYFDRYGVIPEFSVGPSGAACAAGGNDVD